MEPYKHQVKYYETDRMGFAHHSNYVRWMEEARIDFLEQIGWSYQKFEQEGVISPVTAIECKYKHSTTFPETISIAVSVEEMHGIRLRFRYVMTNESGTVVFKAMSEHCFVGKDGKIVRMKRDYPEFYHLLKSLADEE